MNIDPHKYSFFIFGVVATACLWWFTEKMLNKHLGPKVDNL